MGRRGGEEGRRGEEEGMEGRKREGNWKRDRWRKRREMEGLRKSEIGGEWRMRERERRQWVKEREREQLRARIDRKQEQREV